MSRVISKKELDILEESGYWKAASFLSRTVKKLQRKHLPLDIGSIKHAHQIIFLTAKQPEIAGKYRTDNGPELTRIDGTPLKVTDWHYVPNEMAILDHDLREQTKNLSRPKTKGDYRRLISMTARLSHRLASIHPFRNGNGRASRLLLNAILLRADLTEIAIKEPTTKRRYLQAMRSADDGSFEMLEDIIKISLQEALAKTVKEIRISQSKKIHGGGSRRKR